MVRYIKKHKQIFIVVLVSILVIRIITNIYKFEFKYKTMENVDKIEVKVLSLKKVSEDKISYLVKYNNHKFILNLYKNRYDEESVNLKENEMYKYGDILELNGKIVIPETLGNPYEFNYKKYLNSNDIIGTITTYKLEKVKEDRSNFILSIVNDIKKDYEDKVSKNLNYREVTFLNSMLFSDDTLLEEEIKESASILNLSYIFNISSKNIFSIFFIIGLFRSFFKDRTINLLKIFSCILIYLFSSMSYSTLRAVITILITISLPSKIILKRGHKLLISIYIILIINPYSIFDYSFIFTVLIILSSMFFYNRFSSFLDVKIKDIFNYKRLFKNKKKLVDFILKLNHIISFNLCIIIFILPFQISISGSFNFISIFSNIFIMPLISVIHFLGYLSVLTLYIFNISDILINACYIPIKCILFIIEKLNFFTIRINLACMSYFTFILYYFVLFIIIFKDDFLKRLVLKNKKKRIILKRIISILLMVLILVIIFEQFYIVNFESYIIYFNVKQGNMCLIKNKNEVVIVDMGSTSESLAGNILNTFLKAKNIKSINLILLTHMHSDHINGIFDLDESIKVSEVAFGKIWHDETTEYKELVSLLNSKNVKYYEVKSGDEINLKNIKISIISPNANFKINAQDEINANSGVYNISINNKNYLFMGDATVETEESILKNNNLNMNQIEIIQVGHHGSKTSTSEDFIKFLNIKYALISSYKKVYKHPAEETLKILDKYKIKYHITEQNKALKIRL